MADLLSHQRAVALQERCLRYACCVRSFIRSLARYGVDRVDNEQLWRSSGSIGANYIEAREAMSRKDFLYRIRLSRKEARESLFWLHVIHPSLHRNALEAWNAIVTETNEIISIFTAIAKTTENNSSQLAQNKSQVANR
ncbi:MAG: four helix bundle protein [Candidatus Peribacter sp.]|nr:four helix bundle protein [Candidatus Peribacter sp.]